MSAMTPKTRKRLLALLAKRRKERDALKSQVKGLLASYNTLYDDFMREKVKVCDRDERLRRLVDGGVETSLTPRDIGDVVEFRWRVSKLLLRSCRDRNVIWEEVFHKLRVSLAEWKG